MNRKQRRQQKKQQAPSQQSISRPARHPKLDKMFEQGKARMHKGDLLGASEIFQSIMQQKPDHIGAVEHMGICAMRLKQYDIALNFFNALKQAQPINSIKWDAYIGCVYSDMERYEEAIPLLKKAYKKMPIDDVVASLATAHFFIGDFEKGQYYLEKLLESDPDNLRHLNVYANRLVKFNTPDHPLLLRFKDFEEKAEQYSPEERKYIYYTLFKAYEDLQDYEIAFEYAIKGAQEHRKTLDYSNTKKNDFYHKILHYYSKDACATFDPAKGHPSERPVFIISMPRSGTTLLEQILNAHKDIAGIGEDTHIHRLITRHSSPPFENKEGYLFGWIQEESKLFTPAQLGKQYDDYMSKKRPNARFVVNKALGLFEHIGYIKSALPNAKFIHIERNALDSCLSTFTRLFEGTSQEYSYDFHELAERYKMHLKFMAHWEDVYGDDILHVTYENLVTNQEEEIRRVLDYIGADWDPACLKHYEQKSIVKTASIEQVRKPVYTTSIERWKNYGQAITPLIESLGDIAPQNAQDWLKGVQ